MDTVTLTQQLEEKLEEIKTTLDEAKSSRYQLNEAQTEFIIIDPLLHLLGYSPLQIYKRGHDSVANNFPDYTLLPNTPHKWFLEVKRLDLHLQDGEAAQAVNYANNQGAEWAVLTNGRTWYIYNAHLPKPLTEKRVIQISDLFSSPDAVGKLLLLSRQSMQSGGLNSAWIKLRVADVVKRQLDTANSPIREQLRKISSEATGTAIDDATVCAAIASLCGINMVIPPVEPPSGQQKTNNGINKGQYMLPRTRPIVQKTLGELVGIPVRGMKPFAVYFEDSVHLEVSSWTEATRWAIEKVCGKYGIPPVPFTASKHGQNYYLNSKPLRSDGEKLENPVEVTVRGHIYYLDAKRDAVNHIKSLISLLNAVKAPEDSVRISLR